MPDSLSNTLNPYEMQQVFGARIPDSVAEAFVISFIVLVLATLAKYIIAQKGNISEWGEMLLELPIDVCAIVATIIASTQLPETVNVAKYALSATLPIFLCAYFRQLSFRFYAKSSNWAYAFAIIDVLIAAIWIYIVINLISSHYVN